jgi:hypothetical protein
MNTYTINTSDTLFIRKEKSKSARESKGERAREREQGRESKGERANITLQCHCTPLHSTAKQCMA